MVEIFYKVRDDSPAALRSVNSAKVCVKVTCERGQPVAYPDETSTPEDQDVKVCPLIDDMDPEQQPLTLVSAGPVDPADGGAISYTPGEVNGCVKFTPNPDKCDQVSPDKTFTVIIPYTIKDSDDELTDTSDITITVECERTPITANDDSATTDEDTPVPIQLVDGGEDPEGDPVTVIDIPDSPDFGTINPPNGGDSVTYTPGDRCDKENIDSFVDTFTFTIQDSDDQETDTATVTVTVTCIRNPPVANDDPDNETDEDNPITIDVTDNDTDQDGDNVTPNEITEDPFDGTAEIVPGGIEYTPGNRCDYIAGTADDAGYTVTFKYTVVDDSPAQLVSNEATVTVYVACIRTPPEVYPEEVDIPPGGGEICPLENDNDAEGQQLTLIDVGPPAGLPEPFGCPAGFVPYPLGNGVVICVAGIVAVQPSGPMVGTVTRDPPDSDCFEYTPNCDAVAPATAYIERILYTAQDADDYLQSTTYVEITVQCPREPPIAYDDEDTTTQDQEIDIDVLDNDTDPNDPDDDVSIVPDSLTQPTYGTATIVGDEIEYDPTGAPAKCDKIAPNPSFEDTFTYKIIDDNDKLESVAAATVTVTVTCERIKPIARNDEDMTEQDEPVNVDVLDNDSNPDGDDPSDVEINSIVDPPTKGDAEIVGDEIKYTPNEDICNTLYIGQNSYQDTFTYDVRDTNDDKLVSDPATVTITVKCQRQPPIANDNNYVTNENSPIVTSPLDGDSDPDSGTPVSLVSADAPNRGNTGAPDSNDDILYTPDPDYCDEISTGYYTAQYEYEISDSQDDQLTAMATVYIKVICNRKPPIARDDEDTTNEGSPVVVDVLGNDSDPDGADPDDVTVTDVTDPPKGTAQIVNGGIKYTPDGGICDKLPYGQTSYVDSFDYEITDDDDGLTDTATVTITISCRNRPPDARNDATTTNEDTSVDIDVLGNDVDPDGDELTITRIVTQPQDGTATIINGKIRFTPNKNFCGYPLQKFTYEISDPSGATDTAIVTVDVKCVNDRPVAVDDNAETPQDESVDIPVLDNDKDVEGDLTVVSTTDPSFGTVTINDDDTVTYTPNAGRCGTDQFTYTNQDTDGAQSTATVTVVVKCKPRPPPTAPVAVCDGVYTKEGTPISIDVLKNDYDTNDPLLDIELNGIVYYPRNGKVYQKDGKYVYVPNNGCCGFVDAFTYRIINDAGLTDTTQVRISILCTNKAPIAKPDYVSTDEGRYVYIPVLKNDYDPEGKPLKIRGIVSKPSYGAAWVKDAYRGYIIYNPKDGFCGGYDMFEYEIQDSVGNKARTSVKVYVRCTSNTYYYAKSILPPMDNNHNPIDEIAQISSIVTTQTASKWPSYIVIGVVTLLFNLLAYGATYVLCIRGIIKKSKQSKILFQPESDDDATDSEQEEQDNLNEI